MGKSILISVAALALVIAQSSTALAWHPKGTIVKEVQNLTSSSKLSDANTANDAVAAKPGDVLRYVVTIKNVAGAADKQYNDMAFIMLKDTLPQGVELVANPAQRVLDEDMKGVVLTPGKSLVREYKVKVVSTVTNAQLIKNTACFEANSVVKDNKQQGCDDAIVKTTVVPPTPVTEQPVTPTPVVEVPQVLATSTDVPAELPHTGTEGLVASLTGMGLVAYAATRVALLRRS